MSIATLSIVASPHAPSRRMLLSFGTAIILVTGGCDMPRDEGVTTTASTDAREENVSTLGTSEQSGPALATTLEPDPAAGGRIKAEAVIQMTSFSCGFSYALDPTWELPRGLGGALSIGAEPHASGCDGVGPHDWKVEVKRLDATRSPVVDASVVLTATMADGHKMPVDVIGVPGDEPGSYVVEGVRFDRSGRWRIEVSARSGDDVGWWRSAIDWEMYTQDPAP